MNLLKNHTLHGSRIKTHKILVETERFSAHFQVNRVRRNAKSLMSRILASKNKHESMKASGLIHLALYLLLT